MYARELALYADVSEATVSRLLSGDRKPSLDLMLKIRDRLGWALEDQADCLQMGLYPTRLKIYMEATDVVIDPDTQTVRCVPPASGGPGGVSSLEPTERDGATDQHDQEPSQDGTTSPV